MTHIEALQNAATYTKVPELTVYEKYFEDKRKTTKKYFLNIGNETISPVLDYDNMNSFILGYAKAFKKIIN